MFLHLGADVVVNVKNIIAIMDMDTSSNSKITREYLKHAEKSNGVINVSFEDLPKSYVVTEHEGEMKVYLSSFSSKLLINRAKSQKFLT